MKYRLSARAEKDYEDLDARLQRRDDKQLGFLLTNLRHNSLHTKKYDESRDIWQARIDRNYRLYFQIHDDTYLIISIQPHPK
jgi:mRNA-degrading endonuclease RelE of RelBE toxin-antitoxin system